MFLRDLTFIDDGNEDTIEKEGEKLINFYKFRSMSDVIQELLRFQEQPYNYRYVPQISSPLIKARGIKDEKILYSLSYALEAKKNTPTKWKKKKIQFNHDNDTWTITDKNDHGSTSTPTSPLTLPSSTSQHWSSPSSLYISSSTIQSYHPHKHASHPFNPYTQVKKECEKESNVFL